MVLETIKILGMIEEMDDWIDKLCISSKQWFILREYLINNLDL